jgi:DNA polymerase III delta prime subunit
MIRDDILWSQKYRPATVDECILPERLKKQFGSMVQSGKIPNMILSGPAGCGKTTIALALAEELNYSTLLLNGSGKHRGVDAIKNTINEFAGSVDFSGRRKLVIYDEFDNSTHDAQLALRSDMEKFSSNCSFIFTANFPEKIQEAIISRAPEISFKFTKDEAHEVAGEFFVRIREILEKESVEYDSKEVAKYLRVNFPDFRRIINGLQGMVTNGVLSIADVTSYIDETMIKLFIALRDKNWRAAKTIIKRDIKNFSEAYNWIFLNAHKIYSDPISAVKSDMETAEGVKFHQHALSGMIHFAGVCVKIMSGCKIDLHGFDNEQN